MPWKFLEHLCFGPSRCLGRWLHCEGGPSCSVMHWKSMVASTAFCSCFSCFVYVIPFRFQASLATTVRRGIIRWMTEPAPWHQQVTGWRLNWNRLWRYGDHGLDWYGLYDWPIQNISKWCWTTLAHAKQLWHGDGSCHLWASVGRVDEHPADYQLWSRPLLGTE